MATNITTIEGNITRVPELKFPGSGNTAVIEFSIAHTPRKLNRNTNEWEDGTTLFLDVQLWGKFAETLADTDNFTKGAKVQITGNLVQQNWDDRETGGRRSKVLINASNAAIIPKKQGGNSGGNYGGASDSPF